VELYRGAGRGGAPGDLHPRVSVIPAVLIYILLGFILPESEEF
jgi:hypothetical protein